MRDDEKSKSLKCWKIAVGFFLGTVNEDAEFFSARLLGVDMFWGVRKGGCLLPTYCSSDHAWRREKIYREEAIFSSRMNNGWKHESGLDTICQVSGHVTPSEHTHLRFALISITVTCKRLVRYHIFIKSLRKQLAVTYLGGEPLVYLVKWLMCWQHFSLKKAKIMGNSSFCQFAHFRVSCCIEVSIDVTLYVCIVFPEKTSFCSLLSLLRFWEILTIFPPRP